MTEHKGHSSKEYACMDKDAEPVDNDTSDKNGALFYPVRTTCGSLTCPPDKHHLNGSHYHQHYVLFNITLSESACQYDYFVLLFLFEISERFHKLIAWLSCYVK
jgi:hypothetical protein